MQKEIYFNEWKFMHMETSNNSSNQSDFDNRFFLVTSSPTEKRIRERRSVSGFWWLKEICDDIHLSKQLNEAERFKIFFFFETFTSPTTCEDDS